MSDRDATPTARLPSWETLVVGLLAGVAGVAGSFAAASFTPAFVAGPVAGFLARRLPPAVVTFAIVVLGDLGDQLNVATALVLSALLLAASALVGLTVGRRLGARQLGTLLGAVAVTVVAAAVTGAPLASTAAGLAAGLVLLVADLLAGRRTETGVSAERRRVLGAAASALAFVVGGTVLGARTSPSQPTTTDPSAGSGASVSTAVESLLEEADRKSLDVAGLEPLVSESFYQVDVNATDPTVDAGAWTLTVTGDVATEVRYTYDEVRAMDAEHRFVTLQCVGDRLNGKKLDNALWTGVPMSALLDPAGPAEECCVVLRAADGYYEEFPLAALQDAFLAYGMNGDVLPRGHGYPARALVPGHWGEINVKWLTEIEVLAQEQEGYWEQRGWHGTGPVNTVAKLHVLNRVENGRIQVAGHAYAGTRGVRRVEVSTDGGTHWSEASLSVSLPGTDVWRQWQYTYDPPGGDHEVVVRATDGNGSIQPQGSSSPFPSGPSGWVSRTVRG